MTHIHPRSTHWKIALPLFLILLNVVPQCAQALTKHHMTDAEDITNLLESGFWGYTDSREGTVYQPGPAKDNYNLVAFNLGVVNSQATWNVSDFTWYNPPQTYDVNVTQLSENNTYGETALQASEFNWGGYMRSADWNGQGNRMTLRYNYKWSIAPKIFTDQPSDFKHLRVSLKLAIPHYDGPVPASTTDQLGWCVANVVFRDLSSQQFLTFICTLFDTRGFKTENGAITIGNGVRRENSSRVASGEMVVYCFLADQTRYCTKLLESSNSRILPWTDKTFFGYSLSRDQMMDIIQKANNWLATHPDDPGSYYSTNLEEWVLWEANIGIEGTRMTVGSFAMSFIGDNFDISSEHQNIGTMFMIKGDNNN